MAHFSRVKSVHFIFALYSLFPAVHASLTGRLAHCALSLQLSLSKNKEEKRHIGEGRGSSLVHLLVIVLCLVAFGFAIAAERRRCTGHMEKDERNATYHVYNSGVATGYGVGAFVFLLPSESLLMGVTKCMCFGRPSAPGGDRAWLIIYFASSWMTFLVAEACLLVGATKNAHYTKYRRMIYEQNFSCETLRKGVFIAR